jgi:hypothetical protein
LVWSAHQAAYLVGRDWLSDFMVLYQFPKIVLQLVGVSFVN